MKAARVLVVANPRAGLRRGRHAGDSVAHALTRRGSKVELVRSEAPGHARQIAARAAEQNFDLVLAVGGDGTIHEVANGAAGTGVAVAVAPAGTMNLFARVLGLPLDPVAAATDIVFSARKLAMRPGRADETLFLLMAGIGFDAWVLRETLSRIEGKVSFRDYLAGALRGLRTYPFPEIGLSWPGGNLRATSAILGRTPLYGGFLRPTPAVSTARDELELCALDVRSAAAMLRIAPALFSGGHLGYPGVTNRILLEIQATSTDPDVPVQVDGEMLGALPMTFGLSSRTLFVAY